MERPGRISPAFARRRYGLLAAFACLAMLHGALNPLFESSDELRHIGMAVYLVREGRLPIQQPGVETPWRQEGSQPPLYYMLLAGLTRGLRWPMADFDQIYRPNPHAAPGDATQVANRNQALHGPWERFPWRGAILTLHLWRIASILIAMAGVAATAAWLRWAFPSRPAWSLRVVLLMTLNPMFLFISASVNNDVLVNSLAAIYLYLYLLFRIWRAGPRIGETIALGLALGTAALAKLSGLLLWPLAGALLLARLARDPRPRSRYIHLALPFLIAIAVSGWWFLRNWQLYGDPTGLSVMLAIAGRRAATLADLLREWEGFRRSFWGVFGWMNIVMSSVFYNIIDIYAAFAMLGFALFTIERRWHPVERGGWVILLGYAGLVLIGVIRWTSMTMASQGRLMFTALGPVLWMLWVGWEAWMQRIRSPSLRTIGLALPAAFLGTLALSAPPLWIAPAYRPAPPPPEAELASLPRTLHAVFDGKIRLLGVRPARETVRPGQALDVWLYFEALQATDRDWSLFVHLLDEVDIIVAQHDGYPLQGLGSTRMLQPGQRWREHVRLRIPRGAVAPTPLSLAIGFYDLQTGQRFRVAGEGADPSTGDHVRIPIGDLAPLPGEVPNPVGERFGGAIELAGFQVSPRQVRPGETVVLTLYWRGVRGIPRDYTVFTHILQPPETLWGQHDKPPTPPTSQWRPGSLYVETYSLTLKPNTPPGFYEIEVGLYRPDTGERLRTDQGEDRVLLSRIRVLP